MWLSLTSPIVLRKQTNKQKVVVNKHASIHCYHSRAQQNAVSVFPSFYCTGLTASIPSCWLGAWLLISLDLGATVILAFGMLMGLNSYLTTWSLKVQRWWDSGMENHKGLEGNWELALGWLMMPSIYTKQVW